VPVAVISAFASSLIWFLTYNLLGSFRAWDMSVVVRLTRRRWSLQEIWTWIRNVKIGPLKKWWMKLPTFVHSSEVLPCFMMMPLTACYQPSFTLMNWIFKTFAHPITDNWDNKQLGMALSSSSWHKHITTEHAHMLKSLGHGALWQSKQEHTMHPHLYPADSFRLKNWTARSCMLTHLELINYGIQPARICSKIL
jgi:hypothetical protein